ncbi:hypothetical protein L249_8783 [Ophiocordyceps polyrhachis-furcata BCC 54312]|uniref:N-acetylglucosamine-induced protein 1 n=1 Tax=Ophiocordyceps polyrhachis-furcata BCC 54312 TaxID=1330021 RepID=A0A367L219_9HYPO|nr:hypothetical protein L249_8783 [Ophiocordyceps polyrhachis-furcata BCC 54312]
MGDEDMKTTADGMAFALTAVDRELLSQTDDQFKSHSWQELKEIIGEKKPRVDGLHVLPIAYGASPEANDLAALKRKPSDLGRYIKWATEIKKQYGSMTAFILANRLPRTWGQPPFSPESQIPFDNAADYKVLRNDWPYGMESGISHLVVWSRTPIPTDAETGDLTAESRALIQGFVNRYFLASLGPGGEDRVLWFKNWVALQSVRSLEHFHVLVCDVDEDQLERWVED